MARSPARVFSHDRGPYNEPQAANVAARDPKAAEAIGRALKAHYAELVDAPLPEKFLELLARFEARIAFLN